MKYPLGFFFWQQIQQNDTSLGTKFLRVDNQKQAEDNGQWFSDIINKKYWHVLLHMYKPWQCGFFFSIISTFNFISYIFAFYNIVRGKWCYLGNFEQFVRVIRE